MYIDIDIYLYIYTPINVYALSYMVIYVRMQDL